MGEQKSERPKISSYLLWEYNVEQFDFEQSGTIVVERVIERGNLEDWREMMRFYGREKVLEVVHTSKHLSPKDKKFSELFVYSELVHAA